MRIASAEERYFTNFNQYTDDFDKLRVNSTSEKFYYLAEITLGNSDQTYEIKMKPQAPQDADVACGDLTINNTGFKDWSGAHPSTNGACW